jgi:hypothetical protein
MRAIKLVSLLLAIASLVGCAHTIDVSPNNLSDARETSSPNKVNTSVGYYIPIEHISLQVTTPGGGGDSVKYHPYRDIEASYEKMLNNVFERVVRLRSAESATVLSESDVKYIITPDILTNSGSSSMFTWPPTNFSVDLTSNIKNSAGVTIATPRVLGNGQVAGFSEFKNDFGLAGRIAMADALMKMQQVLLEIEFEDAVNSSVLAVSSISEKLEELKRVFEEGLISQEEYDAARREILENL